MLYPDPEQECFAVLVPLRKKVAILQFRLHNTVLNKTGYLEGTISPMEMGTLLSGGQKERSIPLKHGPKYL
jgi:hypothetical protein